MTQVRVEQALLTRINHVLQMLSGIRTERTHSQLQEAYSAAIGICQTLYGSRSIQLAELQEQVSRLRNENAYAGVMDQQIAMTIRGVLLNAKADIEDGIVSKIYYRGAGAAMVDLLSLAEQTLEEEQKDVAAVLSAAAFEDAMKTKAEDLGLDVEDKKLPDVISALKASSFLSGPQANVVRSYVPFRNKALHAEWDKIQKPEVAGLIAFLKKFIADVF